MWPVLALATSAASAAGRGGSHYATLGVGRGASADEIRAAYKRCALASHPDKHAAEARGEAQRQFEAVNEAFSVLGNAESRRAYDAELDYGPSTARARAPQPQQRREVEVLVRATLEQLGGWHEVEIPLTAWTAAFGYRVRVTRPIAARLGLPLRLHLPPGSADGDRLLVRLDAVGVDAVLRIECPAGRASFTRRADALLATRVLPAWHNARGAPAVRLRAICGKRVLVKRRGVRVPAGPTGLRCDLEGYGMPIRGAADGVPESCERGELRVRLLPRPLADEIRRAANRAAAIGLAAWSAARARRRWRFFASGGRRANPTARRRIRGLWRRASELRSNPPGWFTWAFDKL